MTNRVLIVDDREGIRLFISDVIKNMGLETLTASDGYQALQILEKSNFHLLITDLKMPRMDGMALIKKVHQLFSEMEIIVLTAHGTIDSAVKAMKLGVFDYLSKPLDSPEQLRIIVKKALEHRQLRVRHSANKTDENQNLMIAVDPAMNKIVNLIGKVAATNATVLLTGQSGTGKEVVAREIHRQSNRSNEPFIAVNCAAISPQLVESEMFGHEKGAFTGAGEQRYGRFETANGGTLFLDEVAELPLELQAKLLRVLQEQRFERVGGNKSITVDVRIVAATNKDLQKEIINHKFRDDLFHRLAVFPIHLPALKNRLDDIVPLVNHLLFGIAKRLNRTQITLNDNALNQIMQHSWPGNVRELGNVLERAAIICDNNLIKEDHLFLSSDDPANINNQSYYLNDNMGSSLKDVEKDAIKKALIKTDGHRKKAADLLEIGLRTLYSKIKEYDLE